MPLQRLPEHRQGLLPIAGCTDPDRDLDLILVHGLGGDAFTTWMADPDRMETFWPDWLAADRPRLGIWTLGYAADASGWKSESMALADRGTQVLDLLETEGIGERPLLFVTHSLGGIVAKQLLRHAVSFGVPRWRRIGERTRGIAFIATPHSGANIASFAEFASAVFRTNEQVRELAAHDARLRELHGWFRGFYTEQGLNCRTWCERREVRPEIPLLGLKLPKGILVVDATSAEPNLPGEIAIPLDEDHLSICKPGSRNAQIYRSLLRWVDECARVPTAPGTQAVDRLAAARFDCFLSHNSSDRPRVRALARALADRGLRVWLDEDQLRPGLPWQPLLESGIRDSAAVAVCIAADGLGPWQNAEMQAALQLAARNPAQPVMAVLLPGAPDWPALPAFLTVRGWVDLQGGMSADGLDRLVWGITGRRAESPAPDPQPAPAGPPPAREPAQPRPAAPGSPYPRAAAVWRQKLDYLLEQEAVTSNAAQRFELSNQIAECRAKLRELGLEP